jgi:hypothetical protein
MGTIFSVQKALPLMGKGGSIILTGSSAGTTGAPTMSVYSASKAAVRNLARTWAEDLKGTGIRVNVPSPGATATELAKAAQGEGGQKVYGSMTPLQRQAVFREGVRTVAAGASPMALRRGIEKAVTAIIGTRDKDGKWVQGGASGELSRPVDDSAVAKVGSMSANGDLEIGKIIAGAMKTVGKDRVITVEDSKTGHTLLETVEGTQFDRGYLSPYFVTDPGRMKVVVDEPSILIFERKISKMKDLLPLLEQAARGGKPLLVIAEDVEGEPWLP